MTAKPAPRATAETREFWAKCAQRVFSYQRCEACSEIQFYPRSICSSCQSTELRLEPGAGLGTVATFTIVHRAPTAAFKADVPYVLALVDFDEGFRAMMNVVNCEVEAVNIGMRVQVVFEDRNGQLIPQAQPERADV